ncbi:MAG: TetR/AcrR family transcriptional regulator [FCB group bacterium]|nr:TetR/AcrR family transcriptional regulator [FCB group bacterium]
MNSKEPIPPPANRERLLESAFTLFQRFGIKKVTVEEIARGANVSKMTFYKYFRNKKDILLTIMNRELEQGRKQFRSIMEAPVPFIEKVQKIILTKEESSKRFGEQFLQDLYSGDPSIYQSMIESSQELQEEIIRAFKEEQAKGSIRGDLNMEFLTYMMRKMQLMFMDPELQKLHSDQISLIRELVKFLFYGISPYAGVSH